MKISFFTIILATIVLSCNQQQETRIAANTSGSIVSSETSQDRTLSEAFKSYWYDGNAEITSYTISQERYGELREGTVTNIFVTEDFVPNKQVKADHFNDANISVVKRNTSKKFLTGIYPYSIMTSSFVPVITTDHALKITNSIQEWCGQTYMQLNNKESYDIVGHSYFETEGELKKSIEKEWLEDELWSLIRIDPKELPTGQFKAIPGVEFLRLRHKEIDSYKANAVVTEKDETTTYTISYPEIQRELSITFESTFPHIITGWEERDGTKLKTTAKRLKTLKTPYWRQNGNEHLILRDSLQLPQ